MSGIRATFGRRSSLQPAPRVEPTVSRPAPQVTEPEPPVVAPVTGGIDLRLACLARMDATALADATAEQLRSDVERTIAEIADERGIQINAREQRQLADELVHDMVGLGPLEPLLEDDSIADIMVNGPGKVFAERRGKLVLTSARFRDFEHVANVARRIAAGVGRRIDEGSPMVDARLADGSRVNIIFPPLALQGACISIRKFARKRIDFDVIVASGSASPQMAKVLRIASAARLNIIISGGTGAGKTTLMNALSQSIDPGERIVTVEDAAELQLQQPHVVSLETRPPNLEGKGEVTQRDLVRNALRMRPDRLIVGEVRGPEAFDMLQAMNTGHDGSMSTIHANNTRDAMTRIESMVQMGQPNLPLRAIRNQIVGAVDLIVQLERMRDGIRRITQVTDVIGLEGDVVTMNDIFRFEYAGENQDGTLKGNFRASQIRPSFWPRLEYFNLDRAWTDAIIDAVESE